MRHPGGWRRAKYRLRHSGIGGTCWHLMVRRKMKYAGDARVVRTPAAHATGRGGSSTPLRRLLARMQQRAFVQVEPVVAQEGLPRRRVRSGGAWSLGTRWEQLPMRQPRAPWKFPAARLCTLTASTSHCRGQGHESHHASKPQRAMRPEPARRPVPPRLTCASADGLLEKRASPLSGWFSEAPAATCGRRRANTAPSWLKSWPARM